MPDELQITTTEEGAERPPFDAVLEQLNAHLEANPELREQLRTHPILSGMAGQIAETIYERRSRADQQTAAARAAEDALAKQLKLAEEDPEAFAQQFTEATRARLAAQDLQQVAFKERQTLSTLIGEAYNDLPDGQMTDSELSELAQALAGVPEDKVIGVYTAKRTDIIARRRAAALVEKQLPERLAAEREAWDTEQAAKRVKAMPAPTLRSGTAAGADSDEPDFRKQPQAWNAWYEKQRR